jgi:hypothetical protein
MKKIIYLFIKNSKVIVLSLVLLNLFGTSFSQNIQTNKAREDRVRQILDMMATGKMQFNAKIPTPELLKEPSFTQGLSNFIDFCSFPDSFHIHVEASPDIEFPDLNKVREIVLNASTRTVSFPDEEDRRKDNKFISWIGNKIFYRARLLYFDQNNGGYMGEWSDTVSSTQDKILPKTTVEVDSITIPLGNNNWYTSNSINIPFNTSDEAGIEAVHLYSRTCADTNSWSDQPDDSIKYYTTQNGIPILTTVNGEFLIDKDDGCWEFYVGTRDAAFTPESHSSGCNGERDHLWQKQGNLNEPYSDNKPAHIRVNIDTQEPSSDIICNIKKFINDSTFTIKYEWNDDSPGSGVECVELWHRKDGDAPKLYDSDCPPDGEFPFHAKSDGMYEFYTVAIDSAGNIESSKTTECTTFIDVYDPWSKTSSSDYVTTGVVPVKYAFHDSVGRRSGEDDTSGVKSIWLWAKKEGDANFQSVGADSTTKDGVIEFQTPSDGRYYFYTIAKDYAGNEELPPGNHDDSTFVDVYEPWSKAFSPEYDSTGVITVKYVYHDSVGERSGINDTSGVKTIWLWWKKEGGGWQKDGADSSTKDGVIEFPTSSDGRYFFYTSADDSAGNDELVPDTSDCNKFVDVYEPSSKASSPDSNFTGLVEVKYSYHDSLGDRSGTRDLSGVYRVCLWWQKDGGDWQQESCDDTIKDGIILFDARSDSLGDGTYCFYTIAKDSAGNEELAPTTPDDCTVVYLKPEPPRLLPLPEYTSSTTRKICWEYVNADEVNSVLVQCSEDSSFDPVLYSSGWLLKDDTCFTFQDIEDGVKYWYRGKTKRLIGDISRESDWSDSVSSTQDTTPPKVSNVAIKDLQKFINKQYFNGNTLHITFDISDNAGVDSVFLNCRQFPDGGWTEIRSKLISNCPLETKDFFDVDTTDGYWEFRISGRDCAYSFDSLGDSNTWKRDGNKEHLVPSDNAHANVTIDRQAPDAVRVDSIYQKNKTMVVNWTPSSPKDNPENNNVGFWGYEIWRQTLEPVKGKYDTVYTIYDTASTFVDSIKENILVDSVLFAYSILAFDSLGNIQKKTSGDKDTMSWYCKPPPAPTLYEEPEYTRGDSNVIYWKPVPQAVIYLVEIKRDGDNWIKKDSTSETSYTFKDLGDCVKYSYSVQARAESELLSDYSNIVSSTQDASAPTIDSVRVIDTSLKFNDMMYYNINKLHINYQVTDACDGISKIQLIRSNNDSLKPVLNEPGTLEIELQDGYYELKLAVEDSAFTPESPGPNGTNFELDGNKSEKKVKPDSFVIDTTPPNAVKINGISQLNDTLVVNWTPSMPEDSLGFWGYHIIRNGNDCLASKDTIIYDTISVYKDFIDTCNCDLDLIDVLYRVLPFDSLSNEQIKTFGDTSAVYYCPPPKPAMCQEPEYTASDSNTVYWKRIAKADTYIVEMTNDTSYTKVVLAPENSCTFTDLTDGVKYCYRVKALDEFGRETEWSEPVCSIQDATPPTLHSFSIKDLKPSQGKEWIFTNNITLCLEAWDTKPGKLMNKVEIFENGELDSIKIDPQQKFGFCLQQSVNEYLNYEIKSGAKEPIELVVKIFDCAGNKDSLAANFIYDPIENEISVFPSPFNPLKGDIATIRIRDYREERLDVKIYDVFGNLVRSLVKNEGEVDVEWYGKSDRQNGYVANGGYICVVPDKGLKCRIAMIKIR